MTAPTDSDATRLPLLDLRFGAADVPRLRLSVEACAIQVGLAEPHLSEFLLAVHEVVDNAIRHGGGGGHLRLQRRGAILRCQVRDAGPGFGAQVIPPEQPDIDAETGRGLWLAHQLAEQVTITSGSEGSVVSLTVALATIDELGGRRP
jgi:anti-sigma regulatory factor (Ser/Thr protein kinase)